ncbi:MAG: sec-independent protein translocase protein TatB [Arenicella sp.]|jgi:sec-independent protein translocase protein TatB
MLDIGFFELLVVGVVLIIVMGPERLPEVARQAAFFIRKARQGMFRLRSEMQNEIQGTPFADLEKAKQEMADLKNDLRQFGREVVDSVEQKLPEEKSAAEMTGQPMPDDAEKKTSKAD